MTGAGGAVFRARYASPAGGLVLEATATRLVGVRFGGASASAGLGERTPILTAAAAWLDAYFAGRRPDPGALPVAADGTPFARQVWALVRQIPYGATATYGALAAAVARAQGRPAMSAQAVGGALGRNPVAIVIPCHRVVGAGGVAGGYAGGPERKRFLLGLEAGSRGGGGGRADRFWE